MPKAIRMYEYGAPDVFEVEEIELPPLESDEIRIRTLAAPVNRADLEIRSGEWPIRAADPWPYTPGLEVLGEVDAAGTEVDLEPGDRVITMMQKLGGIHGVRPGGYQEFVTVEAEKVAPVPETVDPFDLAALGLAAVTAYNGIRRLELEPDDAVVIHGASGGVGSCAVSMAKGLGARAIATTSSEDKDEYLERVGADEIVHLNPQSLTDAVGRDSVQAVFETVGAPTFFESVAALKSGGRLCLLGAAGGAELELSAWDLMQEIRLTGYSSENLTGDDLRRDMTRIWEWLADGVISPPPYRTFSLDEVADVHAAMEERGHTGRMLLVPNGVDKSV